MKKKIFSIFLAVFVILSLFAAPAYADQTYDNSWPIEVYYSDLPNLTPCYCEFLDLYGAKVTDIVITGSNSYILDSDLLLLDSSGGLIYEFPLSPGDLDFSWATLSCFSFCYGTVYFYLLSSSVVGPYDHYDPEGSISVSTDFPEPGSYLFMSGGSVALEDGEDACIRFSKHSLSVGDIITEAGGGLTSLLGVVWDLIISNPLLLFFAGGAIVSLGVVFFHKARGNAR